MHKYQRLPTYHHWPPAIRTQRHRQAKIDIISPWITNTVPKLHTHDAEYQIQLNRPDGRTTRIKFVSPHEPFGTIARTMVLIIRSMDKNVKFEITNLLANRLKVRLNVAVTHKSLPNSKGTPTLLRTREVNSHT